MPVASAGRELKHALTVPKTTSLPISPPQKNSAQGHCRTWLAAELQLVAWSSRSRRPSNPPLIAHAAVEVHIELRACGQGHAATGEHAESQLWALQVHEAADGPTGIISTARIRS